MRVCRINYRIKCFVCLRLEDILIINTLIFTSTLNSVTCYLPDNAIFILTRQNKYAEQYRPVFVVPLAEAFYHGLKKPFLYKP